MLSVSAHLAFNAAFGSAFGTLNIFLAEIQEEWRWGCWSTPCWWWLCAWASPIAATAAQPNALVKKFNNSTELTVGTWSWPQYQRLVHTLLAITNHNGYDIHDMLLSVLISQYCYERFSLNCDKRMLMYFICVIDVTFALHDTLNWQ